MQIWMTAEGAIYVDDRPDRCGQPAQAARAPRPAAAPNTTVVIKADQGVTHGRVVGVMDLARGLGLSRLAIATEADSTP